MSQKQSKNLIPPYGNRVNRKELEEIADSINRDNVQLALAMDDESMNQYKGYIEAAIKASGSNESIIFRDFKQWLEAISKMTTRLGLEGVAKPVENEFLQLSLTKISHIFNELIENKVIDRKFLIFIPDNHKMYLTTEHRGLMRGAEDIANTLVGSDKKNPSNTNNKENQYQLFLSNLSRKFGPLDSLNEVLQEKIGSNQPGYIGDQGKIEEIIAQDVEICQDNNIDLEGLLNELEYIYEEASEEGVTEFVDYGITVDINNSIYITNLLYHNRSRFLKFTDSDGNVFWISKDSIDMIKEYGFFGAAEGGDYRLDPVKLAKALKIIE